MPRLRTHEKYIACLESLWDSDVENRLSVKPILELLLTSRGTRYTYQTCNTVGELTYNLQMIPRDENYLILYLSFHGSVGKLHLADGSKMSLDDLAEKMGNRFQNWVVHFGSCGTLAASDNLLIDFMKKTGVSLLIGYESDIDWIESAALDMLIFDWLQEYKNVGVLIEKIESLYPGLVKTTGLRFVPS